MGQPDNDTSGEKATVREVYHLVGEVRDDLGKKIDKLTERVDTVVTSHEHRLTVIEAHQATQHRQLRSVEDRLDSHGKEIGQLLDQQRKDEAATAALQAHRGRFVANWQWAVGAACAAGLLGTSIWGIVH